eukprot:TRINITY_DN8727_c0_g2_i2.p1 TRINITY_DN8727_c0_g2~~TRINITY_DN8727_c0_g2_i2.p1  ORF type:complete len:291 (-),score=30.91 TRINITY_DN8727_c0_g2_i2:73-945(-)
MDKQIIFECAPVCGVTLVEGTVNCPGNVIIAQLIKQILSNNQTATIISVIKSQQSYDALLKKVGVNLSAEIKQQKISFIDVLDLVQRSGEKNTNNESFQNIFQQIFEQVIISQKYQQLEVDLSSQNNFLFVDSLDALQTLQIAFGLNQNTFFGFIEALISLFNPSKSSSQQQYLFQGIILNSWKNQQNKQDENRETQQNLINNIAQEEQILKLQEFEWFDEQRADLVVKYELFEGPMQNIDGKLRWTFRNPNIGNFLGKPVWQMVGEKLERQTLFQMLDSGIIIVDQPPL